MCVCVCVVYVCICEADLCLVEITIIINISKPGEKKVINITRDFMNIQLEQIFAKNIICVCTTKNKKVRKNMREQQHSLFSNVKQRRTY